MSDNNVNAPVYTNFSTKHRGRLAQIPIYLGKFFRMFVYMNDWTVIPMAAIMALLVAYVTREGIFITMEGTFKGTLALMCVALWNGCFNSIQVVCRERGIVKREHRSGLHISSYMIAHMIYQMFLCILQTVTTIGVFVFVRIEFPVMNGIITGGILVDIAITVFLITYAADMLSLFISSVVKDTTMAMTVMPLMLMVQLIFSGGIFSLPPSLDGLSSLMISNQGLTCLCIQADYNNLPSTSGWTLLKKIADSESADPQVAESIMMIENEGYDEVIRVETAKANFREDYVLNEDNIIVCWVLLSGSILFYAGAAVIVLEFIDKDKR
ncbi:MAG: ABC transporter permease [Clostridiales bacterium]|nr:ABC transporter permease [Clostridiales bacterium]